MANDRGSGENALNSVRQIERTLEDRQETQKVSEERLAAAREEARRIIAAARKEGEQIAEERRREVLSAADEEAARILEAARAEAETLSLRAAGDRSAASGAVVGQVLPGEGA